MRSCIHVFMYSWIHGFMCSCVHEFMRSSVHAFMDLCIHVFMYLTCSWLHVFMRSYVHVFDHSALVHSFPPSLRSSVHSSFLASIIQTRSLFSASGMSMVLFFQQLLKCLSSLTMLASSDSARESICDSICLSSPITRGSCSWVSGTGNSHPRLGASNSITNWSSQKSSGNQNTGNNFFWGAGAMANRTHASCVTAPHDMAAKPQLAGLVVCC